MNLKKVLEVSASALLLLSVGGVTTSANSSVKPQPSRLTLVNHHNHHGDIVRGIGVDKNGHYYTYDKASNQLSANRKQ